MNLSQELPLSGGSGLAVALVAAAGLLLGRRHG
jgi:hypothetical protein